MLLLGCDFSSAPSARKPIVVALGSASDGSVRLSAFQLFATLDDWGQWLRATPAWVGAFDLPFGLPRELVVQLGWPLEWERLIAHYAGLDRDEIRRSFAAFCVARPAGGKFAHRQTDGPAGSSPSMKWVNPPVAFMLHAGLPRLLAAGAVVPGLHPPHRTANAPRIALEAYPGLLARELIGRRSYKSDAVAGQSAERRQARVDLVAELERGAGRLGLRLSLEDRARALLLDDAKGDHLDAALCLVQAAWAQARSGSAGPGYGLPPVIDPIEGWIATA
ncbi:DUF429 domain-containing protein [Variovorax saccharolyticus]|uniref:DUF429 domain-containing protein n=1 Tax=Variovorax saccharolyticus TaxID=3053516 RepID=UPI002576647E|nr:MULTISPECIES: DUF429 domain-containing protein [unclassified Variovorax]MDM0015973.1 DUF429 domain-containing protein [Variovorax sp. J22R187]MDM0025013.1 DUF429 domain-containing protein [Variovorax sp. J31P216]